MTESLSIIVPVRNDQASITHLVQTLLELAQDLTDRFELVLVDDGSIDHTPELAAEMARQFPQVTAVNCRASRGVTGAIEVGLTVATGDVLIVQRSSGRILSGELCRLWRRRHEVPHAPEPPRTSSTGRGPVRRRSGPLEPALRDVSSANGCTARFELIHRESAAATANVTPRTTELPAATARDRRMRRPEADRPGQTALAATDSAAPALPACLPAGDVPLIDQSIRALYS